jgi:predicted transcriptional regulator
MVKIVIMDWKSFSKMVKKDIEQGLERGSFKKDGDVIYAETLEAALHVLTTERMKLLSTVKERRPASLYALAKLMKKDFKTVSSDANRLSRAGLLTLETYKVGAKKKVRPRFTARKISLELAV